MHRPDARIAKKPYPNLISPGPQVYIVRHYVISSINLNIIKKLIGGYV